MSRVRTFLLAALFLCVFCLPLFSATQEFLSVQVKEGQMRSTPSFLGSVMASLAYGESGGAHRRQGRLEKGGDPGR